jgi:hypothetical protein
MKPTGGCLMYGVPLQKIRTAISETFRFSLLLLTLMSLGSGDHIAILMIIRTAFLWGWPCE